jgi:hypothetical protein
MLLPRLEWTVVCPCYHESSNFVASAPDIAAQLLYFLLTCYVERPLMTAFMIVVPRVLQRRWGRASRHVVEVGVYKYQDIPALPHSKLPYSYCSMVCLSSRASLARVEQDGPSSHGPR